MKMKYANVGERIIVKKWEAVSMKGIKEKHLPDVEIIVFNGR